MTWGSSWGSGWGGGSASYSPFSVVRAYATSSNSFVVAFSRQPLVESPLWGEDATNLHNVALVYVSTGAQVPLLTARPVSGDTSLVEYVSLKSFKSETYAVTLSGVSSLDGVLISDPKSAQFLGLPATNYQRIRAEFQDLYNPQTAGELVNGGLVLGADGDYAKESGVQLLKKLIIRRLITAPGEFFHLADTAYGAGLKAKSLIRQNEIVSLQVYISEQVKKEPEVSDSSVTVTLSSNGIMYVTVQAKLRYSSQLSAITVPIANSVSL